MFFTLRISPISDKFNIKTMDHCQRFDQKSNADNYWYKMRIGELAQKTNLSRDTIRFYERNGLISSDESTSATNSYRDYPEELVERLNMIREAQNAGFSIAELLILFRQLEAPDFGSFSADDFLDRKIAEVEERIERAKAFLTLLKSAKSALMPGQED